MGILIWVVLSTALLVFLVWTVFILIRQKRAWHQYAKNQSLRYRVSGLMLSPEVTGVIDGYSVALFTGEHEIAQARTPRKMSAIEVVMKSKMPAPLAVGSGNMVKIIQDMGYSQEYKPEIEGWNKEYVARATSGNMIRQFLTHKRLQALLKLMAVKNAWVIYISDSTETLLRLDTPDPLDDITQIDKLIKGMIRVAKILELETGEKEVLVQETKRQDSDKEVSLEVGNFDDVPAFEFEDED